jgi:hypothetical protein
MKNEASVDGALIWSIDQCTDQLCREENGHATRQSAARVESYPPLDPVSPAKGWCPYRCFAGVDLCCDGIAGE